MEDEEVELTDLEGKMYAWATEMLPSGQAVELSKKAAWEAKKYGKTMSIVGFICGMIFTLGLLRWLA